MGRLLAIVLATLVMAAPATAATPGQVLAATLEPVMQKQFTKTVKGLVFTKVTCAVPAKSKLLAGRCRAAFTVKRAHLDGVYQVVASISAKQRLGWHTTSVTCTDATTHKSIACS